MKLEKKYREQLKKNFWLVLSTVNEKLQPQSSLVVYQSDGREIYIQTGRATVKAKNILKNNKVAITIPIRKNFVHKLIPVPPAEMHFYATAEILPFENEYAQKVFSKFLKHDVSEELSKGLIWIKVTPGKRINTYGIGIPLFKMRKPEEAKKVIQIN